MILLRILVAFVAWLLLTFLSTAFLFWPGWTETLRVFVASVAFVVSMVVPGLWFARGARPEPTPPPVVQRSRLRYW